jgi:hypothetical protein
MQKIELEQKEYLKRLFIAYKAGRLHDYRNKLQYIQTTGRVIDECAEALYQAGLINYKQIFIDAIS